jgi:hypothetical protein
MAITADNALYCTVYVVIRFVIKLLTLQGRVCPKDVSPLALLALLDLRLTQTAEAQSPALAAPAKFAHKQQQQQKCQQ